MRPIVEAWATCAAQALNHSNVGVRCAKPEFVRRLVAKTAILIIQETRARELGVRHIMRSVGAGSDSAGGAAILVARTLNRQRPVATEHVRVWMLEVRLQDGDGDVALLCIHNYDVGNHEMRRVTRVLHELAHAHSHGPCATGWA